MACYPTLYVGAIFCLPLENCAELAMHVSPKRSLLFIARNAPKRAPQHFLANDAPCDFGAAYVDIWRRWGVCRDQLRPLEVVFIMAPATAQRKYYRKAQSAAPGAANALLIVEAHGRHVGKAESLE